MNIIYSPMEHFDIFRIGSLNIEINNVVLYLMIAASLPIILFLITSIEVRVVSNWLTLLNETLYRTVLLMVDNYIGRKFTIYFPLIYTIFYLVLFSNLIGMVPYSSTPTVEFVITLSIALSLLMGILIIGILSHKTLLFAAFLPAGTPLLLIPLLVPLEIMAYLTRTLALGLRLSVNMITGHTLVKVCSSFIYVAYTKGVSFFILILPLFILTLFLALELLIAYLQAYIFTFITCITLKDMA